MHASVFQPHASDQNHRSIVIPTPPPPYFYGSLAIHGCVDIGDSSLSYALRMGLLSIRDQCRGRVKVILH